jgi:hypothetical protein
VELIPKEAVINTFISIETCVGASHVNVLVVVGMWGVAAPL